MIKYSLYCKCCDNLFDSWFSSSNEYEKLKKKKFLSCHFCGAAKVEKTLMSPSILSTKSNYEIKIKNKKQKHIKDKINEYQKLIKKNFNYVGENFAYEARLLHYNNKNNSKGIYGSASNEEIKELKEEGIEAEIIPWFKNKSN